MYPTQNIVQPHDRILIPKLYPHLINNIQTELSPEAQSDTLRNPKIYPPSQLVFVLVLDVKIKK